MAAKMLAMGHDVPYHENVEASTRAPPTTPSAPTSAPSSSGSSGRRSATPDPGEACLESDGNPAAFPGGREWGTEIGTTGRLVQYEYKISRIIGIYSDQGY